LSSVLYRAVYNRMILPLLWGGSRAFAPFIPKVRAGLAGRVGLMERVTLFRRNVKRPVVLFHCASAGELEALRPLAQEFDRAQVALAVSYFSPSARAAAKRGEDFDFADYSPIDAAGAVESYLDALQPSVVAITKHDIWPNLVWQAHDRGIPTFLINGNFHAKSLRLWPLARQFHAAVYAAFAEIMTVSPEDAARARFIVGDTVPVKAMGDSRFDRVLARIARKAPLPEGVEAACAGKTVLIAGSTHADDEQLLLPMLSDLAERVPGLLTLIVPHDPSRKAKARIEDLCSQHRLQLRDVDDKRDLMGANVVLINRTGILADLYRVGAAAYVGGGFGKGVHSVLEPMAAGLPVLAGPNIGVSHEARMAEHEQILAVVSGRKQVTTILSDWLTRKDFETTLRARAREFVAARAGASRRIAERLREALHARA
jgi:3-deoxy-D-manno-octulosonic-acid transferase